MSYSIIKSKDDILLEKDGGMVNLWLLVGSNNCWSYSFIDRWGQENHPRRMINDYNWRLAVRGTQEQIEKVAKTYYNINPFYTVMGIGRNKRERASNTIIRMLERGQYTAFTDDMAKNIKGDNYEEDKKEAEERLPKLIEWHDEIVEEYANGKDMEEYGIPIFS